VKAVKRTVLCTVILLAFAGVYGALRNLPVVSGCAFYGECPEKADAADRKAAEPLSVKPLSAAVGPNAP
jgi:hypothetical protein